MFTSSPAMTAVEPATTITMMASSTGLGRRDFGVLVSVSEGSAVMFSPNGLMDAAKSARGSVPDGIVAMHATDGVGVGGAARDDVVTQPPVAAQAGLLQDLRVVRLDHHGLVEVLEREALRVVVAVDSLGDELGQQRVGQVAVRALGHGVVAGLHP